jgi:hypothetical protein
MAMKILPALVAQVWIFKHDRAHAKQKRNGTESTNFMEKTKFDLVHRRASMGMKACRDNYPELHTSLDFRAKNNAYQYT